MAFAVLHTTAAQSAEEAASACPDAPEFFAVVTDVSDDLAITLTDGRSLRLAGVEAPRATGLASSRPQDIRDALRSALRDTTIGVALLGSADRWRALPALVFAEDGVVNLNLLAEGRLRMMPERVVRACRDALLRAEAAARRTGLGVWRDPELVAADADAIEPYGTPQGALEGLVVIEGKVASVGETPGRVYVNLGHRRGGFAISLPKRDIALMASDAVKRARTVGTRIRVRGLLDRHSGLRIDVGDADAIEIIE